MFTLPLNKLILVAGGLSTLSLGAPLQGTTPKNSFIKERAYKIYSGNGDTSVGWPSQSQWISSFDTMFENSNSILKSSCTQFGVDNNSDDEISNLKSAISEVASSTGVDSRFIFAIVMQESNGCVRAPTTVYSISNPGLMQSHDGAGSCNSDGTIQNPCPKSEIVQMITDGTAGTSSGDGLKQCITETGVSDVSKYYKAARIYNSGSIAQDGNLGQGVATHCYATDIANRLTGWYSSASPCDQSTIGLLDGSSSGDGYVSSASSSVVSLATSVVSLATSSSVQAAYTSATSTSVQASYTSATSTSVQASYKSVAAYSTSKAGGVYAELPTTSSSIVAATTSAVHVQTEATSTTIAISIPVASLPTSVTTATASPTSTSISYAYPSASSSKSSSNTTYTPGTSCSTPGQWNCIDGNSFQQCSSGVWSTVGGLAAGTECAVGQGVTIDIYSTKSARKRHVDARGLKHSHAHALKRHVLES